MLKSKRQTLGQHFLASRAHLQKVIDIIDPKPDETLIEIGPGKGAITLPLAARAGRVIAIEKDLALAEALKTAVPPNVEIIPGDALDFDFTALKEGIAPEGLKVIGNLPFSISTPLMFRILEAPGTFRECVFIVQKEVADRILAGPECRKYAPISILTRLNYEAGIMLRIPPGAFAPPPQVNSVVLRFVRRPAPLFTVQDEPAFRGFLRESFAERRKKLWNNLVRRVQSDILAAAFENNAIPRGARAEEIPLDGFVRLFLSVRNGGRTIML